MKYISTLFLIALCSMGLTFGQQCDPNDISTNPEEPSPALGTGQQSYWTNQFDWRAESFSVNSPNYTYPPPPGYIWPRVESPFWNNQNTDLDYLFYYHNSDFAPEEGWELIKRGFGFVMGGDPENPASPQGTVNPNSQLVGPYLILYNRYRGVLRVFGTIGNQNIFGYDAVQVKLEFSTNQPDLSGLLLYHTSVCSPLDQYTKVDHVTGLAPFPNDQTLFFHMDFPMAYDPCTCHFGSALKVSFRLIDKMTVTLDGRIAATSTSVGAIVNGTGTVGNPDFLAALHRDGSDVKAGVTTYKRTRDLVNRYRTIADAREQAKKAAAQAGKFPKFLKGALNWLDFGLGLVGLPSFVQVFDASGNDGFVKDDGSWTNAGKVYSNGLKAAGYLNKFASKQVKIPSGPNDPLPELGSIIEGEMTFSGTIEDNDNFGAGITIQNPGSLGSLTAMERDYPTYNEILGLFAVLETPDLYFTELWEPVGVDGFTATYFKFAGDLKYLFNPKLPINLNKTKILASIEVASVEGIQDGLNTLNNPGAMSLNKNVFEISSPGVYTTPWFDLECIEGLDAKIGQAEFLVNFYLKLLIFIEYNTDGLDGEPNRHVLQVAYPLNTINDPSHINQQAEDILFDVSYDQPTTFTNTQVIYAWNDVYVESDLSLDPGAPPGTEVRIIAANSIEVSPDANIGPGITLETGLPFVCGEPIPQTEISDSYCLQKYKARSLEAEKMEEWLAQQEKSNATELTIEQIMLSVFPNPSNGQFEINYSLPEDNRVEMLIQDNIGRQIRVLVAEEYQEKGEHSLMAYLQDVPDGVYHLIVRINGIPQAQKFVKTSD